MATMVESKTSSKIQFQRAVSENSLVLTIWGVVLIMMIVASIISPDFRSTGNMINLLKQATIPGILAIAQTILILSGAIDLSMGAVVTFTSLIAAGLMDSREELIFPIVVLGLFIGTAIGFIHGLLTTRAKLEPFIVTLGTYSIILGIGYWYTTVPVGGIASSLSTALYYGQLGPIPNTIFYFVGIFILAYIMLNYTRFGRSLYAVGGKPEVARKSGLNVDRIKLLRFTLAGFLVAIASVIATARMGIGDPLAGQGMELDAITATVIGGISLYGGRGSLIGTLAGILILGLINNIMVMLDVNMFYQQLIKGTIVLLAVAIYKQRN